MRRWKWISKEQKIKICALALEGFSIISIVRIIGCTDTSIRNILKAKGILTAAKTARRERKSKTQTERIVATYKVVPSEAPFTYLCTVGKDHLLQRLQAGLR